MEKILIAFPLIFILTIMKPFTGVHGKDDLHKQQEVQTDGPYVFYSPGKVSVSYIMENSEAKLVKTDTFSLQNIADVSLKVMTDIPGKEFEVRLKKKLKSEKCEFPKVKKLLALSDIEGNFGAFRKLLLAAKVIDESLNWTFGNGHLVLVGDFFDRGQQVTEILWLIYYLEEKAKAAGGYVHFILGNHEIMNLSGDLRYTDQKYLNNAKLLNRSYVSLYDESSELGRWLRTKKITEKIGDLLFTHGGISARVNDLNISIDEINSLARPYYSDSTLNYKDERSAILVGDDGPFWYRGYYEKNKPNIPLLIDDILSRYDLNHIITGHTIVADTISLWYKGKLLDIDVHHTAGKSEALLIDDGKYYRVNQGGEKILLFTESR